YRRAMSSRSTRPPARRTALDADGGRGPVPAARAAIRLRRIARRAFFASAFAVAMAVASGRAGATVKPKPIATPKPPSVSPRAPSDTATPDAAALEMTRQVQTRYDSTRSFSAGFEQEMRLAAGGQVVRSKGEVQL